MRQAAAHLGQQRALLVIMYVAANAGQGFRQRAAFGQHHQPCGELATLTGKEDFHEGLAMLEGKVPTLVVTRSAEGAVAVSNGERAAVAAEPIEHVVDTTGAGDLFAAGFLFGHVRGRDLRECLHLGAICAAEVISHYGARPEADLKAMVKARLADT